MARRTRFLPAVFSIGRACLTLALCGLSLMFASGTVPRLWLTETDRVLFVGPIGFEQRRFTAMVETYVLLRRAHPGVKFHHASLSTAYNITQTFSPTMVVVDAFTEPRLCSETASEVERLYVDYLARVAASHPDTRLLLLLPPVCPGAPTAGEHLKAAAASMKYVLEVTAPPHAQKPATSIEVAADLARKVVEAWSLPSEAVQVEINVQSSRAFTSTNTKVSELAADDWIFWSQDDRQVALPLEMTTHGFADLDQRSMKVVGLKAERYRLTIDGKDYGIHPRASLDSGLDLTAVSTPSADQGSKVYLQILDRLKIWCDHPLRTGAVEHEDSDPELMTSAIENTQPKRHDYELQPVK